MSRDTNFYNEVWDSRPHVCKECGIEIEKNRTAFAHILPKSVYPQHRHNPLNIVLLCFHHHRQLDQGLAQEMRIWNWILDRRQELKSGLSSEPTETE